MRYNGCFRAPVRERRIINTENFLEELITG
jgi:hypothetical protein